MVTPGSFSTKYDPKHTPVCRHIHRHEQRHSDPLLPASEPFSNIFKIKVNCDDDLKYEIKKARQKTLEDFDAASLIRKVCVPLGDAALERAQQLQSPTGKL